MSVVVRTPEGDHVVWVKGADNVMLPLVQQSTPPDKLRALEDEVPQPPPPPNHLHHLHHLDLSLSTPPTPPAPPPPPPPPPPDKLHAPEDEVRGSAPG